MESTAIITIPRKAAQKIAASDDLVLLPRREYERLKEKDRVGPAFRGYETVSWQGKKHKVPVYQLYGKAAERLDNEVREGLAEYRAGKTMNADSMREALKRYGRGKKGRN